MLHLRVYQSLTEAEVQLVHRVFVPQNGKRMNYGRFKNTKTIHLGKSTDEQGSPTVERPLHIDHGKSVSQSQSSLDHGVVFIYLQEEMASQIKAIADLYKNWTTSYSMLLVQIETLCQENPDTVMSRFKDGPSVNTPNFKACYCPSVRPLKLSEFSSCD